MPHFLWPLSFQGKSGRRCFACLLGGLGWAFRGVAAGCCFRRIASLAFCGRRFSFAPGARGPHSRAMEGMREGLL